LPWWALPEYRAADFLERRRCAILLASKLHFPVIDTMELKPALQPGRNQPGWFRPLRGSNPTSIRLADSRLR